MLDPHGGHPTRLPPGARCHGVFSAAKPPAVHDFDFVHGATLKATTSEDVTQDFATAGLREHDVNILGQQDFQSACCDSKSSSALPTKFCGSKISGADPQPTYLLSHRSFDAETRHDDR